MRVVLAHDWLIHMRGGERVLEALAELYPDSTIYTLFANRKKLSPVLQKMRIKTSWLQHLPGIQRYYRWLLPILPLIIRGFKIKDADLVISSSHCVAKGVRIPEGAVHLCYCHTPMRYLWGFQGEYFERYPFFLRFLIKFVMAPLRSWDLATNKTVKQFIANSENVRQRIQEFYNRDAVAVHPPLDRRKFYPDASDQIRDYYLVVSAFVPYKRVDLVIQAFNVMPRNLLIIGSGPLENEYRRLRKSEKISFLGSVTDAQLRRFYAEAKALIFPTNEDFGIVPLEAQACGTPVIAYRKGGALETVRHGIFFDEQTSEAIQESVVEFDSKKFDRADVAASMESFDRENFKKQIGDLVNRMMQREPVHVPVP